MDLFGDDGTESAGTEVRRKCRRWYTAREAGDDPTDNRLHLWPEGSVERTDGRERILHAEREHRRPPEDT